MAIATADAFRNRTILVAIDGTDGLQLQCRRPELLPLIAEGVLPLDTFGTVIEQLNDLVESGTVIDNRPLPEPLPYDAFVDKFVCAAVVQPRVVLTEDEVLADADAIWVRDLPKATRYEVVRVCNRALASPRLKLAVSDFRRQQSTNANAGPDGATVRDTPVGALAPA